jgi:hypothetical protein
MRPARTLSYTMIAAAAMVALLAAGHPRPEAGVWVKFQLRPDPLAR